MFNINFHQTFKPERKHISSLISFDSMNATKEDLSHKFAIPTGKSSGKVEVNLKYAKAAGLLNYTNKQGMYSIVRTKMGNLVFENDEFLEDYLTQLYIHYMFCRKESELSLWSILFIDFHKAQNKFSKANFINYAEQITKKKVNFTPIIGTYIGEDALISLELLSKLNKRDLVFGKIYIMSEYVQWFSYFLIDYLNDLDPSRKNFTLNELSASGFSTIFGWDSNETTDLLQLLEKGGNISLNKQFDNYHIYINKTIDEIIFKLVYI